MKASRLPSALERWSEIDATIGRRSPAFFLDFDGTLAPLAPRPEAVEVPAETIAVLSELARNWPVCVISGRQMSYLRETLQLNGLYYAADHGHRILGPPASGMDFELGPKDPGQLEAATRELARRLRHIEGATLERKEVSVAVHYRLVAEDERPLVRRVVDEVLSGAQGLRVTEGKMVRELMPDLGWSKGHAVSWLLERFRQIRGEVCPVCLGDDLTDEDMFDVARGDGVTVLVGEPDRPTSACYALRNSGEVLLFLQTFISRRPEGPADGVD